MLDFNFEPSSRDTLADTHKIARASVDRRSGKAGGQPAGAQRRRRRHDSLYSGKPVPLVW